jgi:NAD(P)-dependent dehydrogenase (short-subunit alcohol dehydrogenase family)
VERRLAGKVAVVTGSSRGIGRGIAERLATEGAKVVINGRHAETLDPVAMALRAAGAEVLAVAADVGIRAQVDRLFEETVAGFGGVDILVNNAASTDQKAHILEMDEDHWDTVLRASLKSVYLCAHRAANLMVDQGHPGSIISISSFGAARAHRCLAAYDASKGGLEAFTRAIAVDLAPFGIRANVVGPGAIQTETHDRRGLEAARHRAATVPLGRAGFPADIAGAVAFLASEDAGYITGQVLYVDGGMLAQLRSPQTDCGLPPSVQARRRRPSEEPKPLRAWG